jgi:F0F1-type ATP synthase membrane subunit c/vacuolar-type H+-ATPase subunit K
MATATQEQIVRLAPFQEEFLADIFESAKTLTEPGSSTSMPFAKQQLAGLSEAQQRAITEALGGIGDFAPFLRRGDAAVRQGIAGAQGADFTPTSYQQFMDPFTEDVIRATEADIARQGAMQQNQLGAGAVGAGAFGGSRQGIAQGEIARNVQDQMARTTSQLRSQGFTQAQNLAQQAAQQQLRQAQLGGQLGVSQAGLGQLGQQMGVQDINTLLGIGGLQQQQAQRQFDVTRANELAQQALPFQRIGFMSDIFRGVPALQQTYSTTTTPPPSRTSQLLGLGIAGLGAAGSAGGIGNLFNMGVRPT